MCWLLCGEIDDVEKFESLCTVVGNVKWHNLCGRQYSEHSKKLKIELHMIQQLHFWVFIGRK